MRPPEDRFYTAVLIAAGLLGLLTIFFVTTMVRHQRRNRKLFLSSINACITTLENERRRIVADLHDEIGPIISAVKMHLNHMEIENPENVAILSKSNRYIDDILGKIREISYDMMPNTLVRSGLVPAIEEYIGRIEEVSNTRISFLHNGGIKLSKTAEVNVYRIIQEITHNTLKHADAKVLNIQLEANEGQVVLSTADDGKGFAHEEQQEHGKGYGLINLKSRAEVMNADWKMHSEPGKGTQYLITIPIKEQ